MRGNKLHKCAFTGSWLASNDEDVIRRPEPGDKSNSSDMYSLINEVKGLPHAKVLVSCRPQLDVLSQPATKPNIRLQDLTSEDISDTVTKALQTEFAKVGEVSSEIVENIASTVTSKAHGVFLWVHYVLQNVCTGIRSTDDIGDLQQRIDELPADMMALYRAMIQRGVEDHGIHANTTYHLLGYVNDMPMPLFQLLVLCDLELQGHYSNTITRFDRKTLTRRYESFNTRLPLLSAGLLETSIAWNIDYLDPPTGHNLKYFGTYVAQPIHRSVIDFVQMYRSESALAGQRQVPFSDEHSRDLLVSMMAVLIEEAARETTQVHQKVFRTIVDEHASEGLRRYKDTLDELRIRYLNRNEVSRAREFYSFCREDVFDDYPTCIATFGRPVLLLDWKEKHGQLWTAQYQTLIKLCALSLEDVSLKNSMQFLQELAALFIRPSPHNTKYEKALCTCRS